MNTFPWINIQLFSDNSRVTLDAIHSYVALEKISCWVQILSVFLSFNNIGATLDYISKKGEVPLFNYDTWAHFY